MVPEVKVRKECKEVILKQTKISKKKRNDRNKASNGGSHQNHKAAVQTTTLATETGTGSKPRSAASAIGPKVGGTSTAATKFNWNVREIYRAEELPDRDQQYIHDIQL